MLLNENPDRQGEKTDSAGRAAEMDVFKGKRKMSIWGIIPDDQSILHEMLEAESMLGQVKIKTMSEEERLAYNEKYPI